VPQDVRARAVAQRAAVETQIPTEVLREDPSRSPLHHEGGAGKAPLPVPRRIVDRTHDGRRQSQDCRSAATPPEGVSGGRQGILRSRSSAARGSSHVERWSAGKQAADVIRIGRSPSGEIFHTSRATSPATSPGEGLIADDFLNSGSGRVMPSAWRSEVDD
jgi:hypothetical protein